MALQVYFVLNGNAREAIDFYSGVFSSEAKVMTFGEAPQQPDYQLPEEAKDRVMHGHLEIEGNKVMFSDTFPGQPYTVGSNITLAIVTEDREKLQTYYDQLKEGGQVVMELQETFWSKAYGQVTDKFGVEWQLNLGDGGM
ncbi:VOC family protein [Chungangia koreensis]|uniref:VOC family protein n=1 Tax=Chungangia koreensis TaxID=752657 RepID=A0ABV8WZ46_9LACT